MAQSPLKQLLGGEVRVQGGTFVDQREALATLAGSGVACSVPMGRASGIEPVRVRSSREDALKSRGEALRDYVLRRLLLMIPTFLGITFVTFLLCQFVPGGQIDQMRMRMAGAGAGEGGSSGSSQQAQLDIPQEQLEQLEAYYGFDKPIPVAYAS